MKKKIGAHRKSKKRMLKKKARKKERHAIMIKDDWVRG